MQYIDSSKDNKTSSQHVTQRARTAKQKLMQISHEAALWEQTVWQEPLAVKEASMARMPHVRETNNSEHYNCSNWEPALATAIVWDEELISELFVEISDCYEQ